MMGISDIEKPFPDTPEELLGKFVLWDNGLRVKVLRRGDHPGESIVSSVDGSQEWAVVNHGLDGWKIITEEEARKQHVEVRNNFKHHAFCSCGSWRDGLMNVSLKLSLADGGVPCDEADRIEAELTHFFRKHQMIVKVEPTKEGLTLEAYSLAFDTDGKPRGEKNERSDQRDPDGNGSDAAGVGEEPPEPDQCVVDRGSDA